MQVNLSGSTSTAKTLAVVLKRYDFLIFTSLKISLNQVTPIELTPDRYLYLHVRHEYVSGVIEVQSADSTLLQPRQLLLQPTHHTEPEFSSPTESTIVANSTPEGIQEATVAVEQSYQPERVIVEAGQPVRLHFQLHNLANALI